MVTTGLNTSWAACSSAPGLGITAITDRVTSDARTTGMVTMGAAAIGVAIGIEVVIGIEAAIGTVGVIGATGIAGATTATDIVAASTDIAKVGVNDGKGWSTLQPFCFSGEIHLGSRTG